MGLVELVKKTARGLALSAALCAGAVGLSSGVGGCGGRFDSEIERFSYRGPYTTPLNGWYDADHDLTNLEKTRVLASFGVHAKIDFLAKQARVRVDVRGMDRSQLWGFETYSVIDKGELYPFKTKIFDRSGNEINEIKGVPLNFPLRVNFDTKNSVVSYVDSRRMPIDPKTWLNYRMMMHYVNNKNGEPYVEKKLDFLIPQTRPRDLLPLPPKQIPPAQPVIPLPPIPPEKPWRNDYKPVLVLR